MSIIFTEKLSRHYGRRVGVESIDLQIDEGEIFGFLGPNGAGKSTTIRLLLGFLQPQSGQARIFDRDCWAQSPRIKQDVGYLPGDVRLYPWFTATKALKICGQIRGVDLLSVGANLAERLRLEMNVPVRKMSRGTRQKLGIVLALAHQPRLLILDEPTSGLDPLVQNELADYLREQAADGRTVFFSSHTLSEVEDLCDRIAIVRQGRIVADETLESLRLRARRTVSITFQNGDYDQSQLPSFLHLSRRKGRQLECELEGPTPPLIRWAAQQQIDEISISQPDLESLFRKFYRAM